MTTDFSHMKARLEEEYTKLRTELETVGRVNPDNPKDWEAVPADIDIDPADENEFADKLEEYENNTAILKELEIKYNEVGEALKRIEAGTYGVCTVCGKEIEMTRLEANTAAHTCIEHRDQA